MYVLGRICRLMAISDEQIEYFKDVFASVPGATIRKMFGGIGVFRYGLMFALAQDDGRIAFKVDESTVSSFEEEGCEEWVYEGKTRKAVRAGYWYMPDRLLDEPDEFVLWAERAFSSAARIDQAKPISQRKLKSE